MKNYFIAGGSGGIGSVLVKILSNQGNNIIATYRTNKPETNGSNIKWIKYNSLEGLRDTTILPDRMDGIAFLPGSIKLKPFTRITEEDLIEDYKLQVTGLVKLIQGLMPGLKASGNASIVLFSTVAVQNGFPFHSIISSTKGAIEGLSKSLAAELAPTIRVNCIAPSLTATPLAAALLNSDARAEANAARHPLKRVGKASDIAEMAAFLLSDRSTWISGQVMPVDGGISTLR